MVKDRVKCEPKYTLLHEVYPINQGFPYVATHGCEDIGGGLMMGFVCRMLMWD
jgi:hypothetical protein